jgi:hypothetical protein
VQAGVGDDIYLYGRVAARVVHGTSVDLGDGHSVERDEVSISPIVSTNPLF